MPMNGRLLRPRQDGRYASLRVGLAAYWPLNETAGATEAAVDLVSSLNLAANNSPAQVAGKIGNARQFVAASSQSLSTSASTNAGVLHAPNSSIAFWFRRDAADVGGLVTSDADFTNRGNAVAFLDATDNLYFQFIDSAGGYAPPSGAYWFLGLSLAAPSWNFFAATRNGTAINAWINGTQYSNTLVRNPTVPMSFLRIGSRSYGPSGAFGTATVDEMAIWNRTLSASEVAAIYNSGAGIDLRL